MKTAFLAIILLLFSVSVQAQSLHIADSKVEQGGVLVIQISPQWQGPMVCISALGKQYVPNKNGYVFVGIGVDVKPNKYPVLRIECGRGVQLDRGPEYIEILKKEFQKTRTAGRGKSNRPRKGAERNAIDRAFSETNRLVYDLTNGISYVDSLGSRDLSDPFGLIYRNNKKLGHFGVDIRVPVGTSVMSTNRGKVVLVAKNFSKEGNMIIINHGLGIFSVYMHLSKINVIDGDLVERGQIIGLSGETGAGVREPHLHFSIKIQGNYIDPLNFIDIVSQHLTR